MKEVQIADWVQNAFSLAVEEGNFFGSGNLVPRDHGDVVFDQAWSSVDERARIAMSSQEAVICRV